MNAIHSFIYTAADPSDNKHSPNKTVKRWGCFDLDGGVYGEALPETVSPRNRQSPVNGGPPDLPL